MSEASPLLKYRPIIEGLIFLSGDQGLGLQEIVDALELKKQEVVELLDQIKEKYNDDDFGFELVNYGESYKFVTKASVNQYLPKVISTLDQTTLSQSALEVLAIIAYRQPITRVEIEEIRGVGCDTMLRRLLARDLIQEAGRSEAIGRPYLYEVTQTFLDAFGLVSLDELPQLPQFKSLLQGEQLELFGDE